MGKGVENSEKNVVLAPCLVILGTGSEVGKSMVTAALCRIFSDLGIRVAPFKAQNMSNNSFVTLEGGEIGRAQAVQAQCARLEPRMDMNPLLLKPQGQNRSQVVLHGKVAGEASSSEFRTNRDATFAKTQESLARLRNEFELVVIEGAGSCVEVNLRDFDLANFRTALSCSAPVIIVADISKGGVFAQILGTLDLLTHAERALVKGFVINRFRGDVSLFKTGIDFIEEKSGLPVLGVVPYFDNINVEQEDGVSLENLTDHGETVKKDKINIAVLRLPHISNFTDFQPLARDASVNLSYLSRPCSLEGIDLLIIPGSKNTRGDLAWMGETGWDMRVAQYADKGGRIAGICGGFQMLGKSADDPHGVEGTPGFSFGLGLLNLRTVFDKEKKLARVEAKTAQGGHKLVGYEIHMGVTDGEIFAPFATVLGADGREHPDGAVSEDGKIWGTYIHGLFDEPGFRAAMLRSLNPDLADKSGAVDADGPAYREAEYDKLAAFFSRHLDVEKILRIIGMKKT
ncbi:MAG: cobyric acid synthase [Nitrospinae bacterium]|nr:cobyric acid synthase [Nitrospinota bacterium]